MRASLLESASELFAARGPSRVTVREIAESAGVNHGQVHHYFGSKDGLLRAVLDGLARRTADELAALDALPKAGEWTLGGDTVKLTNLDKVLFPGRDGEDPVTKRDLVRYHACIAPHLLPYLEGRAVNLNRYPDGVEKKGFWSKAVP